MKKEVICLREIDADGAEMWEMVDAATSACIDYFTSRNAVGEYAAKMGYDITEWVEDD